MQYITNANVKAKEANSFLRLRQAESEVRFHKHVGFSVRIGTLDKADDIAGKLDHSEMVARAARLQNAACEYCCGNKCQGRCRIGAIVQDLDGAHSEFFFGGRGLAGAPEIK